MPEIIDRFFNLIALGCWLAAIACMYLWGAPT
jgi:hypothetical protein